MTLLQAVRAYDAGTLADQPDETLLTVQANVDKTIASYRSWADDCRQLVRGDGGDDKDADDYLSTSQQNIAKLEAISAFIGRTTTARYGCQD